MGETIPSADLGGSSKYSSVNLEDRSGEGFHVNRSWTWVSRPQETGMFRIRRLCLVSRKGLGSIFPSQGVDIVWQHNRTR
jgi:hypothetical protein